MRDKIGGRQSSKDLVELFVFGVTEVLIPHDIDMLVEYSTRPLKSGIYLFTLFE